VARETRIQQVMTETGMAYMQAYYHVRARDEINSRLRRNPRAFDSRFAQSEAR
jgi:hypothetical protein